jgi:hypothetical protein
MRAKNRPDGRETTRDSPREVTTVSTLQFALAFRAETEQGAGGRGQQSKKGRTNLEQRRHAFNERGKGKGQEEKKILYFLSIHSTHYDQ